MVKFACATLDLSMNINILSFAFAQYYPKGSSVFKQEVTLKYVHYLKSVNIRGMPK